MRLNEASTAMNPDPSRASKISGDDAGESRERLNSLGLPKSPGDTRVVADIEFLDEHGALVARLDAYECVVDASLNQAFRRNQIPQTMTFAPLANPLVTRAPAALVTALSDTSRPNH